MQQTQEQFVVHALLYLLHPCSRTGHPPYEYMPNYRRYRVPGGTYFFTVNLLERNQDALVRYIDVLREAVRKTRRERPFHIDAWVVLPEITCTVLDVTTRGRRFFHGRTTDNRNVRTAGKL